MASSPITSWQIDGEKVETVTDFIFLVSKITADGDCRHEIKRCLLLEKKKKTAMANLGSILKSKDITLPTKVHTVKETIDAFKLWGWRRLLRVPRIAKRSNESILKEIDPEYSLEGLKLKLEVQSFGHMM